MDIKDFYVGENEKPLDKLVCDGGFCGIFRSITCVGDSLSSGEFEGTNPETGATTFTSGAKTTDTGFKAKTSADASGDMVIISNW